METQVCRMCGVEKELGEFYPCKQNKLGILYICKECNRERSKEFNSKCNYPRRMEGTKICPRCKVEKDVSEYSSYRRRKDGLYPWCRECHDEYRKTDRMQKILKESRSKINHPRLVEGTKVCVACGVEKDVGEFYSSKVMASGLMSRCKECAKVYDARRINCEKITVSVKVCTRCGMEKDANCFNKNKRSLDNLTDWCKDCRKEHRLCRMKSLVVVPPPNGMKKCSQCGVEKSVSEFYTRNDSRDGYCSYCAKCSTKMNSVYGSSDKCREYRKGWYHKNKNGKIKEYKEKNRDHIMKSMNERNKQRKSEDVLFRLKILLRSRLNANVRRAKQGKAGSAIRDLGCSIQMLKVFLEWQWYPHPVTGEMMTWENYGRGKNKWQVDHIVPLDHFNLGDREQCKKACHITNLQPMWWDENAAKSNKVIERKV